MGYHQQIRDRNPIEAELLAELVRLGESYGGRVQVPEHVFDEMMETVMTRFGFLGLHEIREAYRMKSTGVLQVEGAEMYGGVFNADQLLKILTAYCKHRQRVLAAYHRAVEEQKETEGEEKKRERYYQNFPRLVAEGREKYADWREVPGHWYTTATGLGMLALTPEQEKQLQEDAAGLVDLEHQREREEEGNTFRLMSLVRSYEGNRENKIKSIFQKLAVFRHLING